MRYTRMKICPCQASSVAVLMLVILIGIVLPRDVSAEILFAAKQEMLNGVVAHAPNSIISW